MWGDAVATENIIQQKRFLMFCTEYSMELELGKQIIFYPSQNTLKMNEDLSICAGDTNINWDCPRQTGCISPLSVKKRQNSRMIQKFLALTTGWVCWTFWKVKGWKRGGWKWLKTRILPGLVSRTCDPCRHTDTVHRRGSPNQSWR